MSTMCLTANKAFLLGLLFLLNPSSVKGCIFDIQSSTRISFGNQLFAFPSDLTECEASCCENQECLFFTWRNEGDVSFCATFSEVFSLVEDQESSTGTKVLTATPTTSPMTDVPTNSPTAPSTPDPVQFILQRLEDLEKANEELHAELRDVSAELADVKAELSDVNAELSRKIEDVNADINGVKADVASFRTEVEGQVANLESTNSGQSVLITQLSSNVNAIVDSLAVTLVSTNCVSTGICSVSCPAASYVTGGGCEAAYLIRRSYPTTATTWVCNMNDFDMGTTLTAHALCQRRPNINVEGIHNSHVMQVRGT